ncbi:MAG: hypothetical protein ACSHX5_01510 [Phycisphaerales bacterium]
MLVLELLTRDCLNPDHDRVFVRSHATMDDLPENTPSLRSRRVSVLYLIKPGMESFAEIRQLIASMLFKEVIVVLQLDRSKEDWRAIRDAIVRIKKYMAIEVIQTTNPDPLNDDEVFDLCLIDRYGIIEDASIEVDRDDVTSMFAAIRDPKRKMAIARTEYYRTPSAEPAIGRLRDLQHLNLLAYLKDSVGLPIRFSKDRSMIEFGPGAGFLYRFAQTKGMHDLCIVDKNEAFCALASIDGVPKILDRDVTDDMFCESLRSMCPEGADYLFAKGILNVYSHPDPEQYRSVVASASSLIRSCGVWISYNVDRANGHQAGLLGLSRSVFEDEGWRAIDVPSSHRRLIGIDYPPEVDSTLWVYSRS